jgi:translation initiation factor 2 beta subunit (eIF-2beta)/eIF-5
MEADTISGCIQGLLDGVKFKQTAYALDRDSRKDALASFLSKAIGERSNVERMVNRLLLKCGERHHGA